jgi:hypothetical protein
MVDLRMLCKLTLLTQIARAWPFLGTPLATPANRGL